MDNKPLPGIPSAPSQFSTNRSNRRPHDAHELCIQAREHRSRFLRFALDDLSAEQEFHGDSDWIERNKNELLWTIGDALDVLGKCMGQGGWLLGFKRARSLLDTALEAVDDDEDAKIRQLHELASQGSPPTPLPTSKHLLLWLAPIGSRIALPDEDSGFDIIPSQVRCVFKPHVFVFPSEAPGSICLYGLEEWSSNLLSASTTPPRLVGGTFQFVSVPGTSTFHTLLAKLLKLGIYQHLSLLLEQHFLVDSSVSLIFPAPPEQRRRVVSQGTKHGSTRTSENSADEHRQLRTNPSKASLIPNGIFSFFSKRGLGRTSSPSSIADSELPVSVRPGGGSLDIRPPGLDTRGRASLDFRLPSIDPDSVGQRIRRFSFSATSPFSSLSSPLTPTASKSPPSIVTPNKQDTSFLRLLTPLITSKELFSTSPGVGSNVEIPELLVRLANREALSGFKLKGDERIALKEILGWGEAKERDESMYGPGGGMLGIRGFLRHQSISTLVSIHLPVDSTTTSEMDSDSDTESEVEDLSSSSRPQNRASSEGQPSSPPETTPLGSSVISSASTSTNIDQRTKRKAKQKYIPCSNSQPPRWETFLFTKSSRVTGNAKSTCLGEMIRGWLQSADLPCVGGITPYGDVLKADSGMKDTPPQDKTVAKDEKDNVKENPRPQTSAKEHEDDYRAMASAAAALATAKKNTPPANSQPKQSGAPIQTPCGRKRGEHEMRFMHGGVRITARVSELSSSRRKVDKANSDASPVDLLAPSSKPEKEEARRSTSPIPSIPFITFGQAKTTANVNANLEAPTASADDTKPATSGVMEMWMSCAVCGQDNWEHGRIAMGEGTFLLPFGKFLELLIYSPLLYPIDKHICEHINTNVHDVTSTASQSPPPSSPSSESHPSTPTATTQTSHQAPTSHRPALTSNHSDRSVVGRPFPRSLGWAVKKSSSLRKQTPHDDVNNSEEDTSNNNSTPTPSRIVSISHESDKQTIGHSEDPSIPHLPDSRFNIIRHFSDGTHTISFAIEKLEEVFELRVPRVQIVRGLGLNPISHSHSQEQSNASARLSAVLNLRANQNNSTSRPTSVLSSATGRSIQDSIYGGKEEIEAEEGEEKKKLRRDIKVWWEGVSDHVDGLESRLIDHSDAKHNLAPKKSLPRLPSSDDAYENFEADESDYSHSTPTTPSTPKPKQALSFGENENEDHSNSVTPKGTPKPKRPSLPSISSDASLASTASSQSATSTSSVGQDPSQLLSNLRQTFQRTEQTLYMLLAKTPSNSLNEVRRAFLSAGRGVERRLEAWQKKHLGLGLHVVHVSQNQDKASMKEEGKGKISFYTTEPDWWNKSCHVVPSGNIIVREDDWGSIIAFTLSTDAYKAELEAISSPRPLSMMSETSLPPSSPPPMSASSSQPSTSPLPTPSPRPESTASSFFSSAGYHLFRSSSSSALKPDPDQEDVIWHEPEAYSAVISRKEHPKDPAGILSIREVLRQKAPSIGERGKMGGMGMAILSGGGSKIATIGREGSRFLTSALGGASVPSNSERSSVPPSAWAKADVQISREAAGGEVISGLPSGNGDGGTAADRIVKGLDAATGGFALDMSRPPSIMSTSTEFEFKDEPIRRGKTQSIISDESDHSTSTLGPDDSHSINGSNRLGLASAAASKGSYLPPPPVPVKDIDTANVTPMQTRSSFLSLTSGLTTAMRAMLNNSDPVSRPLSAASSNSKHHGLLSTDTQGLAHIDERPHIKYDWTIGKRLKFSCTVYYAKQFDILRKRCGLDDHGTFLRSLSKSKNWSAEGGKSKSNFWKTSDDRWIIKTLVNAWNVADLHVLIDLAPSYFRYLDSTAGKATVLAKLVGFYTIEIRNLETGNVQSKADLLVMENLFYNQRIDKTFDLKGIQGRKVKTGPSSKTLFDGEWIEGLQETLTLVRPHSKLVLREAIRSDAEFLAKSNIMDYSLLLGVDTDNKEIACGLVDTIGSYTFAKTLEYKAKQGLSAGGGKEVTVIPPVEYQERFVSALERYFLACPDKWSKPLDPHTTIISDIDSLASIL